MIEEAPPPSDTAHDAEKDSVKFTFDEELPPTPCIKVVGVGGGGGNAVNRMIKADIPGMEFAAVNTDVQALRVSRSPTKLQLGAQLTQGYGAGSDHKIGRNAALEDTERLIELLSGADMVFVTAGLGGGTGTGAAPVVASLAKEMGALTIAVVTKPFAFEGARRMEVAEQGLAELAETVDTVISIPNEYLLAHVENGTSFFEAFRIADDILLQAVRGNQRHRHDSGNRQLRLRRHSHRHAGHGVRSRGHGDAQRRKRRNRGGPRRDRRPFARKCRYRRGARHPDQHYRLLASGAARGAWGIDDYSAGRK